MAKPIEPTPVLKGEDAKEFLKLTFEAEKKPDQKRAKFLQECFLLYSRQRF